MVVSEKKRLTIRNLVLGLWAVAGTLFAPFATASGQQPTTQVAPVFAIDAKYVQGVGPGYWPTPGAGLTLNLASGTAFCGSIRTYGGGTLVMAASSTNYVYLDTTANCSPAANTTGFSPTTIPIAVATTSASAITSITDDRTYFFPGGTGGGGSGTVTSVGLTMPSWLAVANSPVTASGTLAVTAAASQAPHQVIGTGTGSGFGPVNLAIADLPATVSTTGSCGSNSFETASTNGGPTCAAALTALTAPAHQFFNSASAAGVFGTTQPGFADLVGTATSSQLPAAVVYANQANTYTNGKQTFPASSALVASLNLPSGIAPSTPVGGDVWNQSGTLKFYDGSTTQSVVYQSRNINSAAPLAGGGSLTQDVTLTFANQSANQVLAGPSTYGAAATTPAFRTLAPQDFPPSLLSCAIHDTAICTSAVDAAGNPNFLAADATPGVLDINGGTTPLVLFIGGIYQTLNSNVTFTPPTPGSNDVEYFIWAKQDTADPALVAADFGVTTIAPVYQYTAPGFVSAASGTNPQIWFDLSSNTMKWNTNGISGPFAAQPSIILGAVVESHTPAILAVLCEPYRLNPYKRYEVFRDASGGAVQEVSAGSVTQNGAVYASAVLVDNSTIVTSAVNTGVSRGLSIFSQNPVILVNSGAVNVNSLGRIAASAGTGAGPAGQQAGQNAGSGGSGGAGTTNAGGAGGYGNWNNAPTVGTGVSGGTPGNAGSNGYASDTSGHAPWFYGLFPAPGVGASGGGGGGDGTNNGGQGGAGGGVAVVFAPSILVLSGSSVTANGVNGGAGAGGNAGGGGGGGGGTVVLAAGFITNGAGGTYTPTATGGSGGAGQGTGKSGGNGGNGTAIAVKLW